MILKRVLMPASIALVALGSFAVSASADTTTLDAAIPTANGFYEGSGNDTPTFTIVTSSDGSLQLALKADTAFVGPLLVPDAGTNNYQAAPTTTTRFGETVATWDYYFSVDTNANGSGADLSAYSYALSVTDETTGTTALYNPVLLPDDASMGGLNVVTSSNANNANGGVNLTTQFSAQNAENVGFSTIGFGPTFNGVGTPQATDSFLVSLSILNQAGGTVLSDQITVNGTPEPGTTVLMLSSLGVLALVMRRRRSI